MNATMSSFIRQGHQASAPLQVPAGMLNQKNARAWLKSVETQPLLEQQRLLDTWQHTLAQQSEKHSHKAMRPPWSLVLTLPLMIGGPLFALVWQAPSLWWANVAVGFGIASVFAPLASLLGFAKSESRQGHVDWLQEMVRQAQCKLKPQLTQAEQEAAVIAQEAQKAVKGIEPTHTLPPDAKPPLAPAIVAGVGGGLLAGWLALPWIKQAMMSPPLPVVPPSTVPSAIFPTSTLSNPSKAFPKTPSVTKTTTTTDE
ncbi:MAG: hypothetical protein ACKO34_03835 [Vampirovibrionales bacterium]